MMRRASVKWACLAALLLFSAAWLCAAPALAHPGHHGHAVVAIASPLPAPADLAAGPAGELPPCCLPGVCVDLPVLADSASLAHPPLAGRAGYPAPTPRHSSGADPLPALPPPRG